MAGLYIHIPFCKNKCNYCDFFSVADTSLQDKIVASLKNEMLLEHGFISEDKLDSIYIGGGTPSLLEASEIQSLIGLAGTIWDFSSLAETTIEANPDDLTPEYLSRLSDTAINRISLGIQSFSGRDLTFMGRRHDSAKARNSINKAKRSGFANISIDLIYGIPGMTLPEWDENLIKALESGIQHISAYCLTIEDGTPLHSGLAKGVFELPSENEIEEQYHIMQTVLEDNGFEQYEVSNFALPGYRSRHNSSYWSDEPYLGIGPSAHSYNGCSRRWCKSSVSEYSVNDFVYETEILTETEKYNEFVMTSLRTTAGIDPVALQKKFNPEIFNTFTTTKNRIILSGMLYEKNGHYAIPKDKLLLSDSVIREFII